jgi:RNA polymerase sigma-70 factor (ECF subfamily)
MLAGATRWVASFHAGDRAVLEQCYRDHFRAVVATVGRLLRGADAETVTHEVFYRLLTNPGLRENFRGGNFDAWLTQVAMNAARDHLRRYRREQPESPADALPDEAPRGSAEEIDAKIAIDRFRRERLPPELAELFEARFTRQLSQRDAAAELGMPRTTLIYQEERVRSLLKDFLLRGLQ